jgi:hypothetical protein
MTFADYMRTDDGDLANCENAHNAETVVTRCTLREVYYCNQEAEPCLIRKAPGAVETVCLGPRLQSQNRPKRLAPNS